MLTLESAVIKFAGDSGDGMQLVGSLFTDTTAILGNDIATFPDFPSEIRAPQGTVAGVSGFQIHFGTSGVHSPGDAADVLVAMNPAALKANLHTLKPSCLIIIDADSFSRKDLDKAGFETNPLDDHTLHGHKLIPAPITSLTKSSIADLGLDNKSAERCKNMFTLGMIFWLFSEPLDTTIEFFEQKFKKQPSLAQANIKALKAGHHYALTIEAILPHFSVLPAQKKPGIYRNINGNQATAWGLMAAAQKVGRDLFLGSYPITPATDIMQELTRHKWAGVKVFQAEDEIAGICSAIGASFAGDVAVTTTSGPGMALKTEALGLAVMTELPLVIVNVQRGGPSTGLPTKTEQSDLLQAVWGRNGESPIVVLAASTPGNCFDMAFEAVKIAVEHMTPVILLTESYIANGAEPWKIKKPDELPNIQVNSLNDPNPNWRPYLRDDQTLARKWVIPGTPQLQHRIGGLEKDDCTGCVSHNPQNHEFMVGIRQNKVNLVTKDIPLQRVKGKNANKLLVVGWGGQFGILFGAVSDLQKEGKNIAFTHFNYIHPLPSNTADIFAQFDMILVCELNNGQFAKYLRATLPQFTYHQFNKIQGLPFMVSELKDKFNQILES
ncbi:MAG: 2-oxoacid:acceptor oxidoreductase subunit alpha [Candidatus Competibacteraceae bacterium]|nr:2-oxoacid:acceptor oxidoreductase subunit alpha [Candidatus Competibacteraceae bacterium]